VCYIVASEVVACDGNEIILGDDRLSLDVNRVPSWDCRASVSFIKY